MFDLRPASSLSSNTTDADSDGAGVPAREWADALILDLVMEPRQDRRVFIGPRGALAARLEARSSRHG